MPRAVLPAAAVLLPTALLAALFFGVSSHLSLTPPPRVPAETRAAVLEQLRAVLRDPASIPAAPASASQPLAAGGPVVVTVWLDGRRALRVEGRGPVVADAVLDAARKLASLAAVLGESDRARARLQVDLVTARAPFLERLLLTRLFGLVPGVDGFGVVADGREALLGADELVQEQMLSARAPISMIAELQVGLDFERADASLAGRAGLPPGGYGRAQRRYFRFRADSFVEAPAAARGERAAPLPLIRGLPPGPPVTPGALLEAAHAGGRYLVSRLGANGRYAYEVDLATGRSSDPYDPTGPYSLPRHAGTTYFLAELFGVTRDPKLREPIERALDHVVELVERGGCHGKTRDGRPFACLVEQGQRRANLGSTALAVIAFAEYRRATGDRRYDPVHRALVEWILALQKPNGRFAHLYDVAKRAMDLKTELLYFDGEAALALARSHPLFDEPRMLVGAERALDALVAWYSSFFAGRFFFGEEHWTCIAAEAAWPGLRHDRYREFCTDYAAFLRDQQFGAEEAAGQEGLAGSYGVTPFLVPHNTPAGSRTEAMLSAWELGRHHGKPDAKILGQIRAAVGYLLGQRITSENDFFVGAPDAHGAMPESSIRRSVRIDFVQHAGSAMLRAAKHL